MPSEWEACPHYMCKLTGLEAVLREDDLGEGNTHTHTHTHTHRGRERDRDRDRERERLGGRGEAVERPQAPPAAQANRPTAEYVGM